jgi:hypothetical protein
VNVSIFHDLIFFSCFGFNDFPSWEVTDDVFYRFHGFGLRSDTDRFPIPSRKFAPRCKESDARHSALRVTVRCNAPTERSRYSRADLFRRERGYDFFEAQMTAGRYVLAYGRGAGVGRGLAVGEGLGVVVAVAVAVAVGLDVALGVGVAMGAVPESVAALAMV